MRDALWLSLQRDAKKGKPAKPARPARGLQLVADALVNAAIKGDVDAAKEIFDCIDGQALEAVTGEDGVRVMVRLTLSGAWPAALLPDIGQGAEDETTRAIQPNRSPVDGAESIGALSP